METTESWPLERAIKSIIVDYLADPILSHTLEKTSDDKIILEIFITYGCTKLLLFRSVWDRGWGMDIGSVTYKTCACPGSLQCEHYIRGYWLDFDYTTTYSGTMLEIVLMSGVNGINLSWYDNCVGALYENRWIYKHTGINRRQFFDIMHDFAAMVRTKYN